MTLDEPVLVEVRETSAARSASVFRLALVQDVKAAETYEMARSIDI